MTAYVTGLVKSSGVVSLTWVVPPTATFWPVVENVATSAVTSVPNGTAAAIVEPSIVAATSDVNAALSSARNALRRSTWLAGHGYDVRLGRAVLGEHLVVERPREVIRGRPAHLVQPSTRTAVPSVVNVVMSALTSVPAGTVAAMFEPVIVWTTSADRAGLSAAR
ncbi:MAG TPA: hypothetical protein VGF94_22705 [Kofleriaceae bacterium]